MNRSRCAALLWSRRRCATVRSPPADTAQPHGRAAPSTRRASPSARGGRATGRGRPAPSWRLASGFDVRQGNARSPRTSGIERSPRRTGARLRGGRRNGRRASRGGMRVTATRTPRTPGIGRRSRGAVRPRWHAGGASASPRSGRAPSLPAAAPPRRRASPSARGRTRRRPTRSGMRVTETRARGLRASGSDPRRNRATGAQARGGVSASRWVGARRRCWMRRAHRPRTGSPKSIEWPPAAQAPGVGARHRVFAAEAAVFAKGRTTGARAAATPFARVAGS
jgi:hypothetical protein